ncbi:YdcF family protein [Govanella unica]|uniref:YdcF family protein n=1 Tax=Govanella unica TaxID=2975056 RepID=A0A9X3TX72_9PROT|nr:YdcF family protein [Govania unica]MDA5193393.1 YdcF family protein [Govania unica]
MYGLAAKLFWGLFAPANLIGLLGAFGLLAAVLRWREISVRLIGLCLILLVCFGFLPLGQILIRPLENRFPMAAPTDIARARGIIVLAGSENPSLTESRSQPALGEASTRLLAGVELAKRFPKKPLIFTGGEPNENGITQADVAAMVFETLGVDTSQALYEKESMNTYDSALKTRSLVKPQGKEPWILVTSAYHMPRSIAVFEAAGWTVIPYPVDYQTRESGLDIGINVTKRLRVSDLAVHEWIGLLVYSLLDRTNDFFPHPKEDS